MTPESLRALGLTAGQLQRLRRAVPRLHAWYSANARTLPWRQTRDPYAIWVSEVMLQQTRVAAAVPYYRRWMDRFPTVQALAAAEERDVLSLWEGLGYYSRARNLVAAARIVRDRFQGGVPQDYPSFRGLPGVGDYTAAAVLSIAYGQDLAVVDGNVRRVLCRLVALQADPRRAPHPGALAALAGHLLPLGSAGVHNQAMMELGATLCAPRGLVCGECPLRAGCKGFASGVPETYPPRQATKPVPHHQVAVGIVFRGSEVFIDQRPYGGLLGGLWEFPGGKIEGGEKPEQALHRELREEFNLRVRVTGRLRPVEHAYSHFRVTLHPLVCDYVAKRSSAGEEAPWRWVPVAELPRFPMPRANRKIIEQLEPSSPCHPTTLKEARVR